MAAAFVRLDALRRQRSDIQHRRYRRLRHSDRAEKLGLLSSTDDCLALRKLLNRMVHEHVRDAAVLAEALNEGHAQVPMLLSMGRASVQDCRRRGLLAQ